MRDRYPLQWPVAWKRTQNQNFSKFKPGSPYSEAYDVEHQLQLLGAKNVIITSNMQYRADGLPYARQSVQDTGVAVYFQLEGDEQCIPCDRWRLVEENLRAVARTIEALRGIERWGAKDMVNAAFRGFKALPGGIVTPPPTMPWYEVLGVDPDANALQVKAAYRELIKLNHPDAGGQAEAFQKIQAAYKEWENL
jgi:hypothetical protein